MKNFFIKILYTTTGLSILVAIGIIVNFARGQSLSFLSYTGGTIQNVTYCSCYYDPGTVVEIEQPWDHQTVKLFYKPGASILYSNYNIWETGPSVVASYAKGSHTCMNTSGYACSNSGTSADGDIVMIGSSLR